MQAEEEGECEKEETGVVQKHMSNAEEEIVYIDLTLTERGADGILRCAPNIPRLDDDDIAIASRVVDRDAARAGEFYLYKFRPDLKDPTQWVYSLIIPVKDCEYNYELHILNRSDCARVIDANKVYRSPGTECVRFSGVVKSGGWENNPLPAPLLDDLENRKSRDEQKAAVEDKLKKWEVFLEIEENLARDKVFRVGYRGLKHLKKMGQIRFLFPVPFDEKTNERILNHRKQIIEIQKKTTDKREREVYAKIAKATLLYFHPTQRYADVELSEEYVDLMHQGGVEFPDEGVIVNTAAGDLHLINIQRNAIRRLKAGEAALSDLDGILYGSNEQLQLPEVEPADPIPEEECLNREKINLSQRKAVARALASPDCFFLQGPPGTGKTTCIAELSYQFARRGQRVLVASQANLAVDNVLVRLMEDPSILAIRLGPSDRIDEDGQEFVGDRAVHRWLRSISKHSEKRISESENRIQVQKILDESEKDLLEWARWLNRNVDEKEEIAAQLKEVRKSKKTAKELRKKAAELRALRGDVPASINAWNEERGKSFWSSLTSIAGVEVLSVWQSSVGALPTHWKEVSKDPLTLSGKLTGLEFRRNKEASDLELKKAEELLKTELQLKKGLSDLAARKQAVAKELEELDGGAAKAANAADRIARCLNEKNSSVLSLLELDGMPTWMRSFKSRYDRVKRLAAPSKFDPVGSANFFYTHKGEKWVEAEQTLESDLARSYVDEICSRLAPENRDAAAIFFGMFANRGKNAANRRYVRRVLRDLEKWAEDPGGSVVAELRKVRTNLHQKRQAVEGRKQQKEASARQLQSAYTEKEGEVKDFRGRVHGNQYWKNADPGPQGDELQEFHNVTAEVEAMIAKERKLRSEYENLVVPAFQTAEKEIRRFLLTKSDSLMQEELEKSERLNAEEEVLKGKKALYGERQKKWAELQAGWRKVRRSGCLPAELASDEPDESLLQAYMEKRKKIGEGPQREKRIRALLEEWAKRIKDRPEVSALFQRVFKENVNVVGCTCAYAGGKGFLGEFNKFDVVIVDEVSKATPTELLIPCILGRKVILVGDHKQLAPIFGAEHSVESAAEELKLESKYLQADLRACLFKERYEYFDGLGEDVCCRSLMLNKQYRMHSQIMSGINQFYNFSLEIGRDDLDSDREHGYRGIHWLDPDAHVVWIDVPGRPDWAHRQVGSSRTNDMEAKTIAKILVDLEQNEKKNNGSENRNSIGVTSVYGAQVENIRETLKQTRGLTPEFLQGLRVNSVDQFQGMEKDVIVLSLVLNSRGTTPSPFLRTPERINVAMSRARKLLIIVGSSANYIRMLKQSSHYGVFRDLAVKCNGYRDAQDVLE